MSFAEAVIDLQALGANLRAVRGLLRPGVALLAVVKANAYGHGSIEVSRALLAAGADALGVAYAEEGVLLRRAGLRAPILVMGPTSPEAAEAVLEQGLAPVVSDLALAERLSSLAAQAGRTVGVHLKVDTGMGRLGVSPEEAPAYAAKLGRLPGIRLEGLMSHFAAAEADDPAVAREQLARFREVDRALRAAGLGAGRRHLANSAGVLALPEAHLDLVRPGILLYGYTPSARPAARLALRPALTLRTRIAALRVVTKGQGVSYGHTFVAPRDMRVATIPVGYADGVSRSLSNRGEVLVRGRRAPILGRVCMDMTLVDVSATPEAALGDEAVLIGRQGEGIITADDVAAAAGTISYEVLARIGPRIPRTYVGGGAPRGEEAARPPEATGPRRGRRGAP
ncbi:MAG TPA: alanine racemase [Candidatus Sulfotelmatobacter sp.]|nr:alanine racemase [Candidatus Sulfotelmatobacter sp.]